VDEIRPLPPSPRCPGIALGDGNYSGCAYGYGDATPYSEPNDCPTCGGSGIEGGNVILPHSEFGDPDCCGCIFPVLRDDQVEIICNECDVVVKTVPIAGIRRTLDEMELSLDVASEICPNCGAVNLFPGFSRMLAFRYKECGEGVRATNESNLR
jgi:hypothetical protein